MGTRVIEIGNEVFLLKISVFLGLFLVINNAGETLEAILVTTFALLIAINLIYTVAISI